VSLILITPPAATPISLAEARAQCRVDDSSEDALLAGYIRAATTAIEELSGVRMLDQTWEWQVDAFPLHCGWLTLPLAPLLQLVSIVYQDPTGAVVTLPVETYLIRGLGSTQPARLILAPGKTWPSTWHGVGAVMIRFRAGWIDHNSVPEDLRQAAAMLVAYWFSQREAAQVDPDARVFDVPFSIKQILEPHRIFAI
jgi:uncharacterized phiE125 gp8 family phage protein